ncbi:MAG: hypothetical protein ABJB01_11400 [Rudaea sp.]
MIGKGMRIARQWCRPKLLGKMWILPWLLGSAVVAQEQAFAQECSPFSPDCVPGGITPPAGTCPTGQAPVGFCTVIICIEVCSPVAGNPPSFSGGSGSTSGGGGHGGGSTGGGSSGGGTGSSGGTSSPPPYNYFADTRQLTTDDIGALHWTRTTGATPDGRPLETISNAPLDGGLGELMDPEGKERVVAERQNYLNAVEGGLWLCNPHDDIESMTTSVACQQISSGYELPSGYTTVVGSNRIDGDYPNQANKQTYRNWQDIEDGLTSGRLLDDPTNQTIILAALTASVPAIYLLGAAGDGALEMMFESEEQAVAGLKAGQQVLAAAAVPGATLSSLVQAASNAIATANKLTGPQLTKLADLMEKVEEGLESSPRDIQVKLLEETANMPFPWLTNWMSGDPSRIARFISTVSRAMQEAPIRQLLEMSVRVRDLQNEELQATALRTLSEQAIGALPLENPTLASTLLRGLPSQISQSLGYVNEALIEADGYIPVSVRFEPGMIQTQAIGPDGVLRVNVVVNALIEAVDAAGASRWMMMVYSLPVPVTRGPVN